MDPPQIWSEAVILSSPCCRVIDGLPIDLQPLTNLPQTLLKDRSDSSIVCGADIHQQVSSTGHSLHQCLKHTHTRTHIKVDMTGNYYKRFLTHKHEQTKPQEGLQISVWPSSQTNFNLTWLLPCLGLEACFKVKQGGTPNILTTELHHCSAGSPWLAERPSGYSF